MIELSPSRALELHADGSITCSGSVVDSEREMVGDTLEEIRPGEHYCDKSYDELRSMLEANGGFLPIYVDAGKISPRGRPKAGPAS